MKNQSLLFLAILFCTTHLFSQAFSIQAKEVYSATVYFDFGKHDLKPGVDSILSNVSDKIAGLEEYTVKITAHTDSIGSIKNNLALSQRRSEALKNALSKLGIPDSLIQIGNYGETKPVTPNNTEEGRQHNRRATIEIWKMPATLLLSGRVIDSKTLEGLLANVVLSSKSGKDTLTTDSSGHFQYRLPVGMVVRLDASAKCHFIGTKMTKVQRNAAPVEIPLAPIQTGETIDLNMLYFVGDQAVLLPKSKPELPKLLQFMQINPQMKIEIAGHINQPNSPKVLRDSRHFVLSEKRAKVVYDYLVENGISPERVSYQGYGNWEMRFPNAVSEKQMALNRRVELRVVEGGCD